MLPAKTPTDSGGFRALLKNRNFLLLWGGQILSQVADKVLFVLLIDLLGAFPSMWFAPNSTRSVLMIAYTLPAVLFGSAAGIFVDRFPKKFILNLSNLIQASLLLVLPWLPRQFLSLLLITFLISGLAQVFAPAEQAAIPLLVKRENLMTANALFTTSIMGAMIVGFAIGESVLTWGRQWLGINGGELLVAGLYILSTVAIQSIDVSEPPPDDRHVKVHPWKDIKEGWRYLRKNKLVRNAMLQMTMMYSVLAALQVLSIPLAEEVGIPFGYLLSALGIGMVLVAGVLGHWSDRFHHKPLPLIGFLTASFALTVFNFTRSSTITLGLSAILGAGAALVALPMQTLIQQQTPESMRGKVFGFQNNAVNLALTIPIGISGPLTDFIDRLFPGYGLRVVLLGIGIFASVVGIWAWRSTRRVLEDLI
ncbi:MAG: MFS transporter [Cyanosarcina radialis HA8281-LM2]|jgi:MFS family permease|nr:MFS transporter [Cyanosarcina radialis HA8281-LM2]